MRRPRRSGSAHGAWLVTRPPDLIELFIRPLEKVGVEYMITGGVAAVIYGDPRFTRDVDLVLELDTAGSSELLAAFDPEEFYLHLPPVEVLSEEASRPEGGHFNIIHHSSALRADVYTAGDVALHRWALDRIVRLRVGAGDISVAPIEYVIIRKLEYYRDSGSDRHLRDIAMMLRFSGDAVHEDSLKEWCGRLGLTSVLERAERFDPGR